MPPEVRNVKGGVQQDKEIFGATLKRFKKAGERAQEIEILKSFILNLLCLTRVDLTIYLNMGICLDTD